MAARGTVTLFRVKGIRIGVDYSWFLILFLTIFWLSSLFKSYLPPDRSNEAYVLAVVGSFAFFGSILLHELGHAFAALRNGIGISDITLWMLGGVARLTRDSDSAGTEFKIAVAGPVVTLLIAGACILAGAALGWKEFMDAAHYRVVADPSGPLVVLAWLAQVNLFVLILNLIPAFPLDGGRIARAVAWKITGDRNRATRTAATIGSWLSYGFIGLGILLVIRGYGFSGIWLALIGWMIGQSARAAIAQTEFSSRIQGIRVSDVMDTEPVAIPVDTTLDRAIDEYFLRYRWPWFFAVDAGHRFKGLLERDAADAVPETSRPGSTVSEVLEVGSDESFRVNFDAPLESLLGNENLRRLGALAAVDAEGHLRGVVTAEQVGRALQTALTGPA
jgi:Zn-dependent protease